MLVFRPVPPHIAKVADMKRMQMLVEPTSRTAPPRMLAAKLQRLQNLRARHQGLLGRTVGVDPLAI